MANFGGHHYLKINESWEGWNFAYIQFVYAFFCVKISQQMQLMIFVMIRNLICVVTNACCCYYIEPKKEVERNV